MSYTLRMKSLQFLANHPEFDASREEARLTRDGWRVNLFSHPGRLGDSVDRLSMELTREISDLSVVNKFWETEVFGFGVEYIGVSFPNSLLYQPKWCRAVKETVQWRNRDCSVIGGEVIWRYNCDSAAKTVEVYVDGGQQKGLVRASVFGTILCKVEQHIRITRKLDQLIGAVQSNNMRAADRLRHEILEQVSLLTV